MTTILEAKRLLLRHPSHRGTGYALGVIRGQHFIACAQFKRARNDVERDRYIYKTGQLEQAFEIPDLPTSG